MKGISPRTPQNALKAAGMLIQNGYTSLGYKYLIFLNQVTLIFLLQIKLCIA